MPDPILLGALYAVTAVLALLVLVGIVTLGSVWAWLSKHEHGELRWNRYGLALKVESPAEIRYATNEEVQA